jgi:hypothetical protein
MRQPVKWTSDRRGLALQTSSAANGHAAVRLRDHRGRSAGFEAEA